MPRPFKLLVFAFAGLTGVLIAALAVATHPQMLFRHQVRAGRLALYSDRPFDPAAGQRVLRDVEARLSTSPINDRARHDIFICNANWRRTAFFNLAGGAAGVNYYPLTNNVFIRRADVGRGQVFGASGKSATPPRTLAYYAAHEITHSLTAERIGPAGLWNHALPQWVREGYADYVGLGGQVDIDALYRRYQAGYAEFDWRKSGRYTRFQLLVAFMLNREHWSVDRLLSAPPSQAEAEAMMNAGMRARR